MKKMITAMITLVLVIILVGCGHESIASTASTGEITTIVTFPKEEETSTEDFSEDAESEEETSVEETSNEGEIDVEYNRKQLTNIMFSELGIGRELYSVKTEFSQDAKTCKLSGYAEEILIERMIAKAEFFEEHEVTFEQEHQIEEKTAEKVFINCGSNDFTIVVDGEYTIIINPTNK